MNDWRNRPRVFELNGGYQPDPVPAGYVEPPQGRHVVETIEPSRGWWTQAGKFGFRAQLQVDQIVEGLQIPLFENLALPGPPAPWWVQFFRFDRALDTEESSSLFELRGRVLYGVGGITNVIECDVMQGIQLPIVCNSINVSLVPYNPRPFDEFTPGPVTVGAVIGKGGGAGALPPTYTTPFEQQVGATPLVMTVPLPDFARSICLHTTEPDASALAGATLAFLSSAAMKVIDVGACYQLLTQEKGIAIPAGTNQVVLTTVAGTAGEVFGLQFFLAF